eukprot:5572952-Pleurochrysis_carterae.AAC.1
MKPMPHRRCGCASPMQLLMLGLVHQRKLADTSLKSEKNRNREGHLYHQQLEGHHRVSLRQTVTAKAKHRWGRAGPQ